jgi:hypothetical protein
VVRAPRAPSPGVGSAAVKKSGVPLNPHQYALAAAATGALLGSSLLVARFRRLVASPLVAAGALLGGVGVLRAARSAFFGHRGAGAGSGSGPRSPGGGAAGEPVVGKGKCQPANRAGAGLRRHLGFETQRQWSELAIRGTTPALLALFSLVTLLVDQRMARSAKVVLRKAAWYDKTHSTFADALAVVRKDLWAHTTFRGSPRGMDTIKIPRESIERLTDALCYAA